VRGLVEVAPNAHFGANVSSAAASNTDAADKAEVQAGPGGPTSLDSMPRIAIPAPPIPPPLAASGAEPADPQIEIEIAIAKLNLTHARTRLFAESVPSEKLTIGRVASAQAVLEILQALDVTSIETQPRVVALCGQLAYVESGGQVPIPPFVVGAPLTLQSVGSRVGVRANVARSNTVALTLDCELSHVAGKRTIATPQGPMEQPDVKTTRASARAELKSGEALFLGGLTRRSPETVMVKTPYLGELSGIGSWFHFRRQREIDEELVVLVTPRIIGPEGKAMGSKR
jgi:Flp pilus assembly secretin CpaC